MKHRGVRRKKTDPDSVGSYSSEVECFGSRDVVEI